MKRVPLEAYLHRPSARVYSLVVEVPFAPLDVDIAYLSRGEWNPLTDRFRVWRLPDENGEGPRVCDLMVRKFDPTDGVSGYGHIVVNTKHEGREDGSRSFTVGILSNDEVRARVMLNSMLDIPPSFHRRNELRLVEKRWRNDPDAVMRFLTNVHSALSQSSPNPGGKVYTLRFEPPPGLIRELRRNVGVWWG